jgi:hypothetical protein
VLNLLVAVEVAVGRVTVREAVVDVVGRVVVVGAFVVGLVEETVLVRDPVVDAILERRSKVEVGLTGALLLAVVPASDIRLAVPEIPRFSSPELATDRDFSSAELSDGRERWEAVVDELRGLRVVVDVVDGRVGGLFRTPPFEVEVRVDEAVLVVPEMDVGRFVADVPVTGRLVAVAGVVVFFTGEAFTFSLLLEASGLVISSSLPDMMLDSTGVAGATSSVSTSAGGAEGIGSSVEDIAGTSGWTNGRREGYNKGWRRWYFFGL